MIFASKKTTKGCVRCAAVLRVWVADQLARSISMGYASLYGRSTRHADGASAAP